MKIALSSHVIDAESITCDRKRITDKLNNENQPGIMWPLKRSTKKV